MNTKYYFFTTQQPVGNAFCVSHGVCVNHPVFSLERGQSLIFYREITQQEYTKIGNHLRNKK